MGSEHIHRALFNDEKTRAGFESFVVLEPDERLVLFHDLSSFKKGTFGHAVTSQRLLFIDKPKITQVRLADIAGSEFIDKFPKHLKVTLKDGSIESIPYVGMFMKDVEAILAAVNSANAGDSTLVIPSEKKAEEKARATAPATDYRLYHGRAVDPGNDVNTFFGALLGAPVVVGVFWWAGSMSNPYAVIFRISFWLGLVAAPIIIYSAWADMSKKGPRKLVYAVNEKAVIKKILRGEDHPLWNAQSAPLTLTNDGLGDQQWTRVGTTCVFTPDEVTLKLKPERTAVGTEGPSIEGKIPRTDFPDERDFDRLVDQLRTQVGNGEP